MATILTPSGELAFSSEIKFEELPIDTTEHCPECGAPVTSLGHDRFLCTKPGCRTWGPRKDAFKRRR